MISANCRVQESFFVQASFLCGQKFYFYAIYRSPFSAVNLFSALDINLIPNADLQDVEDKIKSRITRQFQNTCTYSNIFIKALNYKPVKRQVSQLTTPRSVFFHTLNPCLPSGSWFTAIMSLFSRMALNSGLMVARSTLMRRGAANIDHTAICTRAWSSVRPKFPINNCGRKEVFFIFKSMWNLKTFFLME